MDKIKVESHNYYIRVREALEKEVAMNQKMLDMFKWISRDMGEDATQETRDWVVNEAQRLEADRILLDGCVALTDELI